MKDTHRTEAQLLEEIAALRREVASLKAGRADDALRASEARYRAVVEDQTELVVRFLPDGTLTFVNEAYCRYLGMSREELIGFNFLPLLPEEDRAAAVTRFSSVTPSHFVVDHVHRVRTPSGRVGWMHWTNRGIFDDQGRLLEFQAVGRDITDRRAADEALRASEARYRAVVEDQTELITRFTPDGKVTFVNEALCRYFGKTREELLGHGFVPFVHSDDVSLVTERLGSLTPEHPVETHENRDVLPSGGVRWIQWTNRAIFDPGGRLTEIQAVGRDVTERKQAEEALRRSEENWRLLFEQSLDGILVVVEGRVARCNQAFADIHRMDIASLVGKPVPDLLHPEDREVAMRRIRAITEGKGPVHQARRYRALRADGSIALVEVLSNPIDWEGCPALQSIVRDVTERVRLEEELAEALKMEAIGQLAGGIAHDFNNLMTGILCHAGLLKSGPQVPADVRETAEVIEGAARRAAELTSQLLGFARRGKHRDVPVDLNAAVEASVRLLTRSLDQRIAVQTRLADVGVFAQGDPVQMEQVVLNLAMNARDAMPDGGTMTFATEVRQVDEPQAAAHPQASPGRYAVLVAQDTGSGIPKEIRGRIFEPFFTTKPHGKGTGMGLAMVYGIVRNHGGWVEVESEPGRGATFRVLLPAASGPAEPPSEGPHRTEGPGPAEAAAPSGRRILVVDDEALVRNVVVRMLSALGYDAVTAADGREAVEYFRRFGREVGLVIIDMVMPEMDGRECFRALRALDPDLRAVLSTGWGSEGTLQDVLDEGMVGMVQKPFQAAQLAEVVRQALAR